MAAFPTTMSTEPTQKGGSWDKTFALCDIRLGVTYCRGKKSRRPEAAGLTYVQVGGAPTYMTKGELAVRCVTEHGDIIMLSLAHLAAWASRTKGKKALTLRQRAAIESYQKRAKEQNNG